MIDSNGQIKVYEALKWASSFLQDHNYEAQIAERLMLHHTNWTRTQLFADYRTPLEKKVWDAFQADVKRAAKGMPVQHITGEESFYGRSFLVNKSVLIPRPETEELIQVLLQELPKLEKNIAGPLSIVDVGTGSGIIAITLKLEMDGAQVFAIDISAPALEVAKENASRLKADIDFSQGDLLQPIIAAGKKVNVIVSNPPYIPERDRAIMRENVLDHEPESALFAGVDGLDIYKRLVKQIPQLITKPGMIAFEIGHDQGEAVSALIHDQFPGENINVQVIKDINHKERIVMVTIS